jgi:hypothetical protein
MAGEQGDQIGRISPIGPLFTLGGFLITEVAQIFGLLFSAVQVFQKCIGQHFGRFFSKKKQSGHPAVESTNCWKCCVYFLQEISVSTDCLRNP